eukprot:2571272-Rhodomonas_salina.2
MTTVAVSVLKVVLVVLILVLPSDCRTTGTTVPGTHCELAVEHVTWVLWPAVNKVTLRTSAAVKGRQSKSPFEQALLLREGS